MPARPMKCWHLHQAYWRCILSRVHRLQLGVVPVEFSERTRPRRAFHPSQTEERRPGIEEAIDVQSVDVSQGTVVRSQGECRSGLSVPPASPDSRSEIV